MKFLLALLLASKAYSLDVCPPSPYASLGTSLVCSGSGVNIDAGTLYVDCANNRVGIGTASPATKLHMSSGTLTVDGTSAFVKARSGLWGGISSAAVHANISGVVGASPPLFASETSDGSNGIAALHRGGGSSVGPDFYFFNGSGADGSAGGTGATNGTDLGVLRFYGSDTSVYREGAKIIAESEGFTAGASPGRIVFLTTPGGSVTPTEAMRINSTQNLVLLAPERLFSRTKAQVDTLVPGAAGEIIFVSNVATSGDVCVSTGTAAAQWRRIGTAAGCGTNE